MSTSKLFKVIIAGGRDFKDYPRLKSYCKHILKNKDNIEIVSGGAEGADSLGEDFAIEFKLGLKTIPAPWHEINNKPKAEIGVRKDGSKYWKRAGFYRNSLLAEYGDALIAFWNGKSKGTKDMIEKAKKEGLKIAIWKYE